jgi:hypothetical protein
MTSLAHQNKCRTGGRAGDARAIPSGCSGGAPGELPALRHERNSIPGACLMAAGADRSPLLAIGSRSSLFLPAATPFSAKTSRVNCAALASRTWARAVLSSEFLLAASLTAIRHRHCQVSRFSSSSDQRRSS